MKKDTTKTDHLSTAYRDVLADILRQGAQNMLATAIENEVAEYVAGFTDLRDEQGHRLVVRNGYLPPRAIQTDRPRGCPTAASQ